MTRKVVLTSAALALLGMSVAVVVSNLLVLAALIWLGLKVGVRA